MKAMFRWEWQKLFIPPAIAKQKNATVKILDIGLTNPEKFPDFSRYRDHDTVLITGDGKCLADDVKEFNSWAVPHDIYAVNRSLIFHQVPVRHWAAVDIEETMWFTQFVNDKVVNPSKWILRHSIGEETKLGNFSGMGLFDCYWQMVYDFENEYQRRVFVGNTGYFAVLTAIKMGYKKVVIAGMPLDQTPHYYEPDEQEGPNWTGLTYCQWMDFKMKVPESSMVRSMGGYSAFILGTASKEWVV
jgi:hypothetical protein